MIAAAEVGAEHFGVLTAVSGLLFFITRLASFGLSQAGQHFAAKEDGSDALASAFAGLALVPILTVVILGWVIGEPVIRVLSSEASLSVVLEACLPVLPLLMVSFLVSTFLTSRREVRAVVAISHLPNALLLVGYSICAILSAGMNGVVSVWVGVQVTTGVFALVCFMRLVRFHPSIEPRLVRRVSSFGIKSWAVFVLAYFMNNAAVVLGPQYAAIAEVGIYGVSLAIAEVVLLAYGSTGALLLAEVSGSTQGVGVAKLEKVARTTFSVMASTALVVGGVVVPLASVAVPDDYAAVPLVVLLMLPGIVLQGQQRLFENFLYGRARQSWIPLVNLMNVGSQTAVFAAFGHTLGAKGLAIGLSAGFCVSIAATVFLLCWLEGVSGQNLWLMTARDRSEIGRAWPSGWPTLRRKE